MLESLKDEFEMTVQGDVMAFLGIQFKCLSGGEIKMQQIGLIERVLKATGLEDCNPDKTSASQKTHGTDKNGPEVVEQWSYSSVVGMLLYLVANSHLEIAYVVHLCQGSHTTQKPLTEQLSSESVGTYKEQKRKV